MKTEAVEVQVVFGRVFNLGNFSSKRIEIAETHHVHLEAGEDSSDLKKFEKKVFEKLRDTVENELQQDE